MANANGEGSSYYSKSDKRWESKLTVGYDEDGEPIRRKFTGKTRTAVKAKLNAALAARDQGLPLPDNRMTIGVFAEYWIAHILPGEGLAPRSTEWYTYQLRRYVIPSVGRRTLAGPSALAPADVEAMATTLEERGLSHRTQTSARVALGKLVRAAEVRGLVTRNVVRLSKSPKARGAAREVKAFSPAELKKLLDALEGTPWHTPTLVAATTGLRPSELLALHWADITMGDEPFLSVRHAVSHVGGTATLKAPKRERSYRTVPLMSETMAALLRHRESPEAANRGVEVDSPWTDLVFRSPTGTPWRVDSWRHAMARAVPGAHPHRLRHTFATHLLEHEAAVPIHRVAELLGDTVAVVESAYSHVTRPKHEVTAVIRTLLT